MKGLDAGSSARGRQYRRPLSSSIELRLVGWHIGASVIARRIVQVYRRWMSNLIEGDGLSRDSRTHARSIAPGSFGGYPFHGVRMASPARRLAIMATTLLSWWMILGRASFRAGRRICPGGECLRLSSGRTQWLPELRPWPGDARAAGHPCARAGSRTRRSGGEPLPARRQSSACAVSRRRGSVLLCVIDAVRAGRGRRRPSASVPLGSKFDILAHVDSDKLGLWQGGTLDLFTESRLGQSVDGLHGNIFTDKPGNVLSGP